MSSPTKTPPTLQIKNQGTKKRNIAPQMGKKVSNKGDKCLAPCLANQSITWLAKQGTQENEQPNSLTTSITLHIQLSNFHEPLSL